MSVDEQDSRAFCAHPAAMTSPGELAPLAKALPGDPGALAEVLHGLARNRFPGRPARRSRSA